MSRKAAFSYRGDATVGAMVDARLREAGYVRAEVGEADVVVTYCTSQTALEDAYFDDEGLVQQARKGFLLVDLSPSTPSFARELNAVAVVSDLATVEAPIAVRDLSRPDAFADRSNLVCFMGGDEDAVRAAAGVVAAVAGEVRETGGPGSAQLARASHTLQTVAQVVSAVEADALRRAVGGSMAAPDRMEGRTEAASPTAGQVLSAVESGGFEGSYTVEMLMAELTAALTAADDVDLILPQAEACLHLLELLAVIGGADKGPAALSLVYGEEAACAEQGLDWTRAEQAYGGSEEDFGEDDEDLDRDYDYGAGLYPGYPGYPGYSAN